MFFDGEELTDVPGDPHDLRVSEDGRYAAWVVPGPRVVAVDLRSGRAVLSHDDLGERTADPENEDPDPPSTDVLGFSDGYLYFDDPEDQLFRAPIGDGEVEELGPSADHELGSADHWASGSFGDGVGVTADGRAVPTTTDPEAVTDGVAVTGRHVPGLGRRHLERAHPDHRARYRRGHDARLRRRRGPARRLERARRGRRGGGGRLDVARQRGAHVRPRPPGPAPPSRRPARSTRS